MILLLLLEEGDLVMKMWAVSSSSLSDSSASRSTLLTRFLECWQPRLPHGLTWQSRRKNTFIATNATPGAVMTETIDQTAAEDEEMETVQQCTEIQR
ncbi:hypothetical protein ACOMHN_064039 [Nucella lapillus]